MELYDVINRQMEKHDIQAFGDMLSYLNSTYKYKDMIWTTRIAKFRDDIIKEINFNVHGRNWDNCKTLETVYYNTFLIMAKDDFESYMIYLESNRPEEKRFYEPRMKVLRKAVNAMQRLADHEIDELFLSMPPRVGKSTLATFFITWLIGKDSDKSNLYVSYSDIITNAFYNGVTEIINDAKTYRWGEIFLGKKIEFQNSKEETLDIGRKKKYHSLTCRSLYGTLNGATDCSGTLVADDLISGIEEAMNPERLDNAWKKCDNNMLTRAKEGSGILWIGTKWSVHDPIGKRYEMLETNPDFRDRRYEVMNLPALDENDHSNFEYDYGVGFSTKYYLQRRASFEEEDDIASWLAGYQQEPIEREGSLFKRESLQYFNGTLPLREPDRKFSCVDIAHGGGDFVSAPICYQYDDTIYVVDVYYDNGDKKVTQPGLAKIFKKWGIDTAQLEATKTTYSYVEGVQTQCEKIDYHIVLRHKSAPTKKAKEIRIFDSAPDIKTNFVFLQSNKQSPVYAKAMRELYAFTITGKNKHDDFSDSMAMCAVYAFNIGGKAKAVDRGRLGL